MGCVFSTPEDVSGPPPGYVISTRSSLDGKATITERTGGLQRCSDAAPRRSLDRSNSVGKEGVPVDMLMQVQGLQNALAAVSDTPGLGLGEAAEILQGELGVSLVCIHGFCAGEPGEPYAAVLLSACGSGASTVERRPVVTDSAWSSCLRLRGAAAASLHASTAAGVNSLTGDWADLHHASGLCSFLTVPIGSPDRPWGALTLACKDPNGLTGARWHIWPGVAAVTLVHQLRHWETGATCALLRRSAAAPDQIALISQLLQGAEAFMDRAANTVTHARFAVLDNTGAHALIFELSPTAAPGSSIGGSEGNRREPVLVASEMDLSSTLLASAISMRKARFVRDCTTYMQSCARPARDVFTQPAALVASLVVVPLVHGAAAPRAALYLTLEAPNDFSNIQQPLLGFINAIIPLVFARLESRWEEVWSEARAVKSHSTRLHALRRRSRLLGDGASSVGGGGNSIGGLGGSATDMASTLMLLGGANSDDGSLGPANGGHRTGASNVTAAGPLSPSVSSGVAGDEDLEMLADAAPSSQLATCNSKRLCTEAMVKAVEAEIFKAKRFGTDGGRRSGDTASWDTTGNCSEDSLVPVSSDLVLTELIGAGGFGMVWRGSWKKVTAAIKVCFERATEHDAMRDAVEMAVLGAVTHPHIVQVFACLTDMVEVTAGMGGSKSSADLQRLRRGVSSSRSSPLPRPPPPALPPPAAL